MYLRKNWKRLTWLIAIMMLSVMVLAACGDDEDDPTATTAPATATEASTNNPTADTANDTADLASLDGRVNIDGSSTVYPVTQAMAEEFSLVASGVQVPVGVSGTGGGFAKFCAAETDISDASRPISASEAELCAENGIEYIEVPVAYDGISVVVNIENDWAACLTVDELATMWAPESEGEITSWNQIRDDFPDAKLVLYGPGTDSGTYDYFTDAITGEEGASRGDFTGSEDDNVLVQGVASDVNALGFFGFSYYLENQDKLKLVAIDDGNGCVEPSAETINDGTYQPLSRPLFIYINAEAAERPEVAAFVDFYLLEGPEIIPQIGYVPFTPEFYETIYARYTDGRTGSVFESGESSQGVTIDDLLFADEG